TLIKLFNRIFNMIPIVQNKLSELLYQLSRLNFGEFINYMEEQYPGAATYSSCSSFEDQVITHEFLSNEIPVKIFTLDTGRNFAETYSVWNSTNEKYNTKIKAYYPNQDTLQTFIEANGPNSFYESVENRKACCAIRKVEPLQRALKGNKVWITG